VSDTQTHDSIAADILDLGATAARAAGEFLGGPWGVPTGRAVGEFLNLTANALRRGVPLAHASEAIKKLQPLDHATSRAANDARANALPEKP
jgi:hypothetical protein